METNASFNLTSFPHLLGIFFVFIFFLFLLHFCHLRSLCHKIALPMLPQQSAHSNVAAPQKPQNSIDCESWMWQHIYVCICTYIVAHKLPAKWNVWVLAYLFLLQQRRCAGVWRTLWGSTLLECKCMCLCCLLKCNLTVTNTVTHTRRQVFCVRWQATYQFVVAACKAAAGYVYTVAHINLLFIIHIYI